MSVPLPSSTLEGHCSAIHDDILYVLSPSGLQSLPIKENATWSQESGGVSVTGPACAKAADQGALYVVGGTASDGSYGGFQRYWFANKTWDTLSPTADNMVGRTDHSVAYLNDTRSILVYAGSTPETPSDLSSQTFLMSTDPPYNIKSFISTAPPTKAPILQPWNSSHAVLVGGSPYSTEVFTFGPDDGWQPLGTNTSQPLHSGERGVLVMGDDGSKVMDVFSLNVSPNTVQQLVLLDANGKTAQNGQTIGGRSGSSASSRKRKRDLTLENWPSYDSTNAPTATRSEYGLAQAPDGVVAISGGSSSSPVELFNSHTNSWVDAGKFFDAPNQQPLQPSSTTTASASNAASSSQAASAAGGTTNDHHRMLRTLGITLGVLFGVAALFIVILLLLRYKRMKKRNEESYIDEKTGARLSFADRGASFMKEAGGSLTALPQVPARDRYNGLNNNGRRTSLGVFAGRLSGHRNSKMNHHQPPKDSFESTTHLVREKNGMVVQEPMEMMDIGDKRFPIPRKAIPRTEQTPPASAIVYNADKETEVLDDRKRSSGWSKYFATSGPEGPNGISHPPAAYMKSKTASAVSDSSVYSEHYQRPSQVSRIPSSVLVAPLDIDFSKTWDGQRLSHVATGSPSFADSRREMARRSSTGDMPQGMKGLIVNDDRPDSHGRMSDVSGFSQSTNGRRTTLSSAVTDYYNESGSTSWTPVTNGFRDLGGSDRASSLYTDSMYEPRLPSRGKSAGFFPGAGVTYRPPRSSKGSKISMSATAAPTAEWASPKGGAGLVVPKLPAEENRESTMTVFPSAEGASASAPVVAKPSATSTALDAGLPLPAKADETERGSTMTLFPRGVSSTYYADREKTRDEMIAAAQTKAAATASRLGRATRSPSSAI
ncbi:pre-mrna splicing factor clf1 [Teratosphaeria destructans]|uniref:Pre-mrna splicing factor clf1 n=1 Tax=Teratosphaeria destructans TaxID=418781 RepID=A0A9W7SMC4_9PEZI|nr:pre-mrna splicing factor clf1 [Teratosphaeria destructans]